mgnify:CR=1 FL=1
MARAPLRGAPHAFSRQLNRSAARLPRDRAVRSTSVRARRMLEPSRTIGVVKLRFEPFHRVSLPITARRFIWIPMSHVTRRRPDGRLILLLGALAAGDSIFLRVGGTEWEVAPFPPELLED